MKFKLFFLVLFLSPLFLFAQSGVITVFSEDGDKFYLVLNGVKQNAVAQTNVRVDGLTSDYYSGKIVFEDQTKEVISKNLYVKDAATGQFMEMTYKIKKGKDGDSKLKFFGMTAVPPNYTPAPDMYMVHYGQPSQPASNQEPTNNYNNATNSNTSGLNMNVNVQDPNNSSNNGSVRLNMNMTDPNNSNGGGMNMNIKVKDGNGGGGSVKIGFNVSDQSNPNGNVNMNINVQDPNMNVNSTQTSSYSSSSTSGTNSNNTASSGCQYPMDDNSFNAAKTTISATPMDNTKLSTAKSILSTNCMTTDQVVAMCKLINMDDAKLELAKYAYSRTVDPSNFFKVLNVFTFENNKTQLSNFISNGGR